MRNVVAEVEKLCPLCSLFSGLSGTNCDRVGRGQELRVAGIYELRVQAALGGWGGGSFSQNNI